MTTRTLRASVIAAVALLLAACSAGSGQEADAAPPAFDGTHVDAAAFEAATQAEGVTVIDVRTPEEFAEGHLPGAINLDVQDPAFSVLVTELDPDANYAIYCRSGNRSRAAQEFLTQMGVTHTVGLEGGIAAWTGDVVTG